MNNDLANEIQDAIRRTKVFNAQNKARPLREQEAPKIVVPGSYQHPTMIMQGKVIETVKGLGQYDGYDGDILWCRETNSTYAFTNQNVILVCQHG